MTLHFIKGLALAQDALIVVKRRALPSHWPPRFLCYRLASRLLFPIVLYGGEIFTLTAHMIRTQSCFWHAVQWWCTNCFVWTPADILNAKSSLSLIGSFLPHKRILAGLWVVCFPLKIHPIRVPLPGSVQMPLLHSLTPHHRTLLASNRGSLLSL